MNLDVSGITNNQTCNDNRFGGCIKESNGKTIIPYVNSISFSFNSWSHVFLKTFSPIQSAMLKSKLNFRFGKVEIKAKLPRGDWLWPALCNNDFAVMFVCKINQLWYRIGLLPNASIYGEWPKSGEIDIMESRGNDGNYSIGGRNAVTSSLHWGQPDYTQDRYRLTTNQFKLLNNATFAEDFHIFGMVINNLSSACIMEIK